MEDYKNVISHIDIERSSESIQHLSFEGIDEEAIADFREDIEGSNDSIELQLVKSKAYKEALVLKLKASGNFYEWKGLLKEEQKTFGGSKIFYMNHEGSKLLILSLPNEMTNKLNMLITRFNKVNEKISRANSRIKKDNLDVYEERMKDKQANNNKKKDEIINFINQNLKV